MAALRSDGINKEPGQSVVRPATSNSVQEVEMSMLWLSVVAVCCNIPVALAIYALSKYAGLDYPTTLILIACGGIGVGAIVARIMD